LSPIARLLCGGIAGVTSVVGTYPLDITRTRLSIQSASFAALKNKPKDKLPGMWPTMVTMFKEEGGIRALYRGIIPTVAGVAPYVSTTPFYGPYVGGSPTFPDVYCYEPPLRRAAHCSALLHAPSCTEMPHYGTPLDYISRAPLRKLTRKHDLHRVANLSSSSRSVSIL
jgi:hypothetical protein